MKRILWISSLWLLAALTACQKDTDPPAEEALATFPPPAWREDESGQYAATMTAVVTLPPTLQTGMTADDQLAAFINNECRGVGLKDTVAGVPLYFVMIRGLPDEQSKIVFKYYQAKTKHLYQTGADLTFLIDAIYGTAQQPKALALTPVK